MIDQPRLGFCCKYLPPDGDPEAARAMNTTGTTIAFLARQQPAAAYDKVGAVVRHNLEALRLQIAHAATRSPIERLHRLPSDILPGYTHPDVKPLYHDRDLRRLIEAGFAAAGMLARRFDVRLSMHPSQFCVIASESESALKNGVEEFEYHAEMMGLMGYGRGWHPHGAHINIHAGARAVGIEGFRAGLAGLSEAARNLITVENDEVSYGLDDLLPLADSCPIVLDLHHHWIASGGEYILAADPRIAVIRDSWRGVRPISHISVSREDVLTGHDPLVRPDFAALTATGVKARDLRGHSDLMWNKAVNDLVAAHLAWSDFEVEAKAKNLASGPLARHVERRLGDQAQAAQ